MSWLGVVRTASGGLRRHLVQAVAIGLVVLVSTASATLGLALLAAGHAPFQHAFGSQRGADVAVTVNTARAGELLERMGLEQHRSDYPARLSGGQRQRVAIARALVNSPELLLADEPTGALDTASGREIGALLRELNAAGQTLVLVTHDPALAGRYAARTVRLVDGQLAGAGLEVPA